MHVNLRYDANALIPNWKDYGFQREPVMFAAKLYLLGRVRHEEMLVLQHQVLCTEKVSENQNKKKKICVIVGDRGKKHVCCLPHKVK